MGAIAGMISLLHNGMQDQTSQLFCYVMILI